MRTQTALVAGLTALVVAGCGTSDQQASTGHNRPAAPTYTEQQIIKKLDLRPSPSDPDGMTLHGRDECVASVIMTTPDQISTYAGAGDPVATNPAGTVGIKVGTFQGVDERMCFDRFQAALRKLP